MLAMVRTAAVCGLTSVPIDVEVDVAKQSFPAFTVVGLGDKAIDEAKERVRSALRNSGAEFPQYRITVNLAPADLPKNGPSFDLPIAVGLLLASEQLVPLGHGAWFAGELSLDGTLRPITGVLAIAAAAQREGAAALYVPVANAVEAAIVNGLTVYGVASLTVLVAHLRGDQPLQPVARVDPVMMAMPRTDAVDMADILGQDMSKRALEIAAAGGHNVLLQGLPGSGKTLLARAFPSLLPPLSMAEALEVSTLYSICGLLGAAPLVTARPFRTPHHTTSTIGLIGGGATPKPGEVSLAHRGVLFLDEFAEFPRVCLEALRQPLEDGAVSISRAKASVTFPARFQLVAAQNLCPCGHLDDPYKECTCTHRQIALYQKRISGPLLDRIDLFVTVPRVEERHYRAPGSVRAEASAVIRERVTAARSRQERRFAGSDTFTNAAMSSAQLRALGQMDADAQSLLAAASKRYALSTRAYFRVAKVARTVADLAGHDVVCAAHISEALQYRRTS